MWLTCKYRPYPTPATEEVLLRWLHELRFLYNYALEERRAAWETD